MDTFNTLSGISILLIAAIIIGVIIVLLYKRKINKALKGEQSGAHTSLPAPADTIGGIYKIVVLIMLVWLCLCTGRLSDISTEIENVKNLTMSNSQNLSQELYLVQNKMEELNSRVFSYTVSGSSVDASDNTCIVKHVIRLKSFSDNTEVTFVTEDGNEVTMERTGEGRFEAEIKTDIFKDHNEYPGIIIKENGTNYFEELDNNTYYLDSYWQLFIPKITSEFGLGVEYKVNSIKINDIVAFSEYKSDYKITAAKIVVEKNGTEFDCIDATNCFDEFIGDVTIPVNKEYDITEKDSLDAKLILETEEGYILEQLLFEKTENRYVTHGNSFIIKNKNGATVYKN